MFLSFFGIFLLLRRWFHPSDGKHLDGDIVSAHKNWKYLTVIDPISVFRYENSSQSLLNLSSAVLDIDKIKSATKHLLKASLIDSIVITSALSPDLLVWEAVQTQHLYSCGLIHEAVHK